MSMENFINSLSEQQKKELKNLLGDSDATADKQDALEHMTSNLPEEHKRALNELDPAYHDSYIETHKLEKKAEVNEDFTVIRNSKEEARRRPVKFKKNTWTDDGEFRDVETPDFEKTPRRRPAQAKSEIECHVCGKKFKADTRYLSGEFHRCNKCTGR